MHGVNEHNNANNKDDRREPCAPLLGSVWLVLHGGLPARKIAGSTIPEEREGDGRGG